MSTKDFVTELASLGGIAINGSASHDIAVLDDRFYSRVSRDGSLGLGESYMEGWWDTQDLAELHRRIAEADLRSRIRENSRLVMHALRARLFNLQARRRSYVVAEEHYDLTIKAYRCMTDPWITLSCGYWQDAETLDRAQAAKHDLICRKIGLNESHHVLDIGCGFGSFVRFAAENYGCRATGINISTGQIQAARKLANSLPVEFVLCDYRDMKREFGAARFDHVVSAGMFEHVGYRNCRIYMESIHEVLKPDGLFLLHTIGSNVTENTNDPWFDRYIFPNGMLPSIAQIGTSIEGLFTMEDWHNYGYDYFHTLTAWNDRFEANWGGPKDDAFYRMWKYYLLCSAGQFKARRLQLWQLVLAKNGAPKVYQAVR